MKRLLLPILMLGISLLACRPTEKLEVDLQLPRQLTSDQRLLKELDKRIAVAFSDAELTVYDRFGAVVYHATQNKDLFQGFTRDQQREKNTYLYQLNYTSVGTTNRLSKQGMITLE